MDKLQEAREAINRVDNEMARLFVERMRAAAAVAGLLPVFSSFRTAATTF